MAQRTPTYHFRMHELLQVGFTQSPVPVISDVASIHDLPEKITQVLPGHLHGLEQAVLVVEGIYMITHE